MFILKELGKSKSCEETPAVRRRRRQRRKGANDADVEMKRRSVYSKDFCRYLNLMLLSVPSVRDYVQGGAFGQAVKLAWL